MTNPNAPLIPEEILRAEQRAAEPTRPDGAAVFGVPGMPAAILDLIIQYGPILVLAAGTYGAFIAAVNLIAVLGAVTDQPKGWMAFVLFVNMVGGIAMATSYAWLKLRRRLGWNMLAAGLIVTILGQTLASGFASILYTGVELLVTAYIMLQVRDSYSG